MNSIEIYPIWIALDLKPSLCGETKLKLEEGLVLRRGYVLEYLVVNRIVVKRVIFK